MGKFSREIPPKVAKNQGLGILERSNLNFSGLGYSATSRTPFGSHSLGPVANASSSSPDRVSYDRVNHEQDSKLLILKTIFPNLPLNTEYTFSDYQRFLTDQLYCVKQSLTNPAHKKSLNAMLDEDFFNLKTITNIQSSLNSLQKILSVLDRFKEEDDYSLNNTFNTVYYALAIHQKLFEYYPNDALKMTLHPPLDQINAVESKEIKLLKDELPPTVSNEETRNLAEFLNTLDVLTYEIKEKALRITIEMLIDERSPLASLLESYKTLILSNQ